MRPATLINVTSAHWDRLQVAFDSSQHAAAFAEAWANRRALFESPNGLRGRPPLRIEWKGTHQSPGFEFLPVDLRIDHVYLVSCKYQSKILANSSPSNLFLRRLADRTVSADPVSWYERCAPDEYQHFYDGVRRYIGIHSSIGPVHRGGRRMSSSSRPTSTPARTETAWSISSCPTPSTPSAKSKPPCRAASAPTHSARRSPGGVWWQVIFLRERCTTDWMECRSQLTPRWRELALPTFLFAFESKLKLATAEHRLLRPGGARRFDAIFLLDRGCSIHAPALATNLQRLLGTPTDTNSVFRDADPAMVLVYLLTWLTTCRPPWTTPPSAEALWHPYLQAVLPSSPDRTPRDEALATSL